MRGIAKQQKMSAAFGRAWCEKGFHLTAIEAGKYITYGDGLEPWPEPCRICVQMYEEEGSPITITDREYDMSIGAFIEVDHD